MTDNSTKKAAGDGTPAIETFNLTKIYGTIRAVDDLGLKINKGELFALLGPNGAGKTTTINMLCCLLKPTSGTASVMGYDINRQPYKIKEIIGTSPQETAISEWLNPVENLMLIGRIQGLSGGEAKKRALELLEVMGLSQRSKDQVRKLSGGLKRRLSVMMALIHNPEVIMLDEPTLGLDPQARRAMWEFISKLKGHKTILLTTHYMEEADFLADRIGIIDDGRIAALGTSRDLKISMVKKHTLVINAWNITNKVSTNLHRRHKDAVIDGGNISISGEQLDLKEIINRLSDDGAIVRSASIKEPTLEDVFLHITGKELRP